MAMRRRSILGSGTGVAPVRMCGLMPEPDQAVRPARHSVVSRQLNYASNNSSTASASAEAGSERESEEAKARVVARPTLHGTIRTRQSLAPRSKSSNVSGRVKGKDANQSVADGISELTQSMANSSIVTTVPIPTLKTPRVSVSKGKGGIVKPGSMSRTASLKWSSSKKLISKASSPLAGVTRIPRLTFGSSSKQATPSHAAQLNTTAIFEEDEMAVLTSTPHLLRSKHLGGQVSTSDSEIMKLFFVEQRNLMQVFKLNFQKMNTLLDGVTELNLNVKKILEERKSDAKCSQCGASSFVNESESVSAAVESSAQKTLKVPSSVAVESKIVSVALESSAQKTWKVPSSVANEPKIVSAALESSIRKTVLSPLFEENKENCAVSSRNSPSYFSSFKF